ncbi:hypothetical protein [Frigoriglobus tundricola]|uniref:Uncharacterized protein n=1 Tax=Frigoriglobus tundricola TaxID=2774151 RepID=A0A6M5YEY5_9BACT|nr:hypothetical protein [Frigoriglobus tundricola]QJW92575.1 hypothetical protein FTUN_0071 [Frigoriglobus tundricola]
MTPNDAAPDTTPRRTGRRLPPGLLRREDAARFCGVGAPPGTGCPPPG